VDRLSTSEDDAETLALLKGLQKALRSSSSSSSRVDTATKRAIFNALATHVTHHTEDAETLSVLLDVLLLLRDDCGILTNQSVFFFSK
jgi:hypothetical protein